MSRVKVGRKLSDYDECLKVHKHLLEVMETDGDGPDGKPYYKYTHPWSDKAVGQQFGYEETQIARFRSNRDMNFSPKSYSVSPFSKMGQLESKITDLTAELALTRAALTKSVELTRDAVKVNSDISAAHGKRLGDLIKRIEALEDAVTKPRLQSVGDLLSSTATNGISAIKK